eukprot:Hpha_TRINITY_DN15587_c1_g14::TRINITY_DN15587_c1_g14_i1::g.108479::m.108479
MFTVLTCADLFGSKCNLELTFPALPSVAELQRRVEDVFNSEMHATRPPGAPVPPEGFRVSRVQIYDDVLLKWVDLISSTQLHEYDQLYVFQPQSPWSVDTQQDLPAPRPPSGRDMGASHQPPAAPAYNSGGYPGASPGRAQPAGYSGAQHGSAPGSPGGGAHIQNQIADMIAEVQQMRRTAGSIDPAKKAELAVAVDRIRDTCKEVHTALYGKDTAERVSHVKQMPGAADSAGAVVDASRADTAQALPVVEATRSELAQAQAECVELRRKLTEAQELTEQVRQEAEYEAKVRCAEAESQGSVRRLRVRRGRLPDVERASTVKLLRRHWGALRWFVHIGKARRELKALGDSAAAAAAEASAIREKLERRLASRSAALSTAIEAHTNACSQGRVLVRLSRYRAAGVLRRQRALCVANAQRGAEQRTQWRRIWVLFRWAMRSRQTALRLRAVQALGSAARQLSLMRRFSTLQSNAAVRHENAQSESVRREAATRAAALEQAGAEVKNRWRAGSAVAMEPAAVRAVTVRYFRKLAFWRRHCRRRRSQERCVELLASRSWRDVAGRFWKILFAAVVRKRRLKRKTRVSEDMERLTDRDLIRRTWTTLHAHSRWKALAAATERRCRAELMASGEQSEERERKLVATEDEVRATAEREKMLQGRCEELSVSSEKQRTQLAALQKEKADLERRVYAAEPKANKLEEEVQGLRQERKTLECRLRRLQTASEEASGDSQKLQTEKDTALSATTAELKKVEAALAETQAALQEANAQMAAHKAAKDTADSQLAITKAKLDAAKQSAAEKQASLESELGKAQENLRKERVSHAESRVETNAVGDELAKFKAESMQKEKELQKQLNESSAREMELDDHLRAATTRTQELAEGVERVVGESARKAAELETRCDELVSTNAELEALCQGAQDDARVSGERLALVEGKLRETQSRVSALEEDLHKVNTELGPLMASKEAAEARTLELAEEMETARKQMQQAEDDARGEKSRLKDALTTVSQLETEMKLRGQGGGGASSEELEEALRRAEQLEEKLRGLEAKSEHEKQSLTAKSLSVEALYEQSEAELQVSRAENADFKNRLSLEQAKLAEVEAARSILNNELRETREKLIMAERKCAALAEQVKVARGKVEALETLAERAFEEVARCSARAMAMETEVAQTRQSLEELQPQADGAVARVASLDKQLEGARAEYRMLAANCAAAERRQQSLEKALRDTEERLENAERERMRADQGRQRALNQVFAAEAAAAGGNMTLHTDPATAARRRQSLAVHPMTGQSQLAAVLSGVIGSSSDDPTTPGNLPQTGSVGSRGSSAFGETIGTSETVQCGPVRSGDLSVQ